MEKQQEALAEKSLELAKKEKDLEMERQKAAAEAIRNAELMQKIEKLNKLLDKNE